MLQKGISLYSQSEHSSWSLWMPRAKLWLWISMLGLQPDLWLHNAWRWGYDDSNCTVSTAPINTGQEIVVEPHLTMIPLNLECFNRCITNIPHDLWNTVTSTQHSASTSFNCTHTTLPCSYCSTHYKQICLMYKNTKAWPCLELRSQGRPKAMPSFGSSRDQTRLSQSASAASSGSARLSNSANYLFSCRLAPEPITSMGAPICTVVTTSGSNTIL